MSDIAHILDSSIQPLLNAAAAASELLRTAFQQAARHQWNAAPDVLLRTKSSVSTIPDYVTNHDVAAQALIERSLTAAVPGVLVIGEEGNAGGITESMDYFLVDPCDGTTNFAHGVPYFSVSIARITQGVISQAVVQDPMTGLVYAAVVGQGAALFDPSEGDWRRIIVSGQSSLRQHILIVEESYGDAVMQQPAVLRLQKLSPHYAGVRKFGSTALDLARLASGLPASIVSTRLKSWDIAAGVLLAREAGAVVHTLEGGLLTLDSPTLVATTPQTAEAVAELLLHAEQSGKQF